MSKIKKLCIHSGNLFREVYSTVCRRSSQANGEISSTLPRYLPIWSFSYIPLLIYKYIVVYNTFSHKPVSLFISSVYDISSVAICWTECGQLHNNRHSIQSVVQLVSTQHRRFSPGIPISFCSYTGPTRDGHNWTPCRTV